MSVGSADSSVSLGPVPPLRCLFLDNYDSYSYNLVHLLAQVSGCEPIVRFNTSSWSEVSELLSSHRIDCVVVSPGPGNPERAEDFGVCARVFDDQFDLPVLGICLGLQGQAAMAGCRIVNAREPMHGRLSALAHDGRGLFEGVPAGAEVVRYNSLVAETNSLPSHLHVSAWAECIDADGASHREIMGLRDVGRVCKSGAPLLRESVQFHPESICTQHGRRMMWNWFDMVAKRKHAMAEAGNEVHWHTRDVDVRSASASTPAATSTTKTNFTLLWQKLPFYVDSERAFLALHGSTSGTAARPAVPPSAARPSAFWLDTSKVQLGRSRFSYMGDNSGPLAYTMWYDVQDAHQVHTRHASRTSVERLDDPNQVWKLLERKLAERRCAVQQVDSDAAPANAPSSPACLPFDFECGFVGYIGYAMKQRCTPDSLPPMHIEFSPPPPPTPTDSDEATGSNATSSSDSPSSFRVPDLAFIFADRMLVFDHQEHECYLLGLCDDTRDDANAAATRAWMTSVQEQLASLATALTDDLPLPSPSAPLPPSVSIHSDWFQSESEYLHAIGQSLSAIKQGESYEICLTNQLNVRVDVRAEDGAAEVHSSLQPLEYYRVLRRVNPAAFAAFFQLAYDDFSTPDSSAASTVDAATDSWSICCSSPERFLQVTRDRLVESKPIKGTLPRGATPEEDEALKRRLQESTKDFAENLMIVDLLRNDLGRVCEWGTVRVPKLMEVESYATVHNLVSTVQGQLRDDASTFDLLRAAFPPGSMTGAPKLRTCQILSHLEREPSSSTSVGRTRSRGIYSGNIGWIGLNGGMSDLNVVIRTAIVRETVARDSGDDTHIASTHFTIGAGGAIVYLSDPHEEYAEIKLKTKALVDAIRRAASMTHTTSSSR